MPLTLQDTQRLPITSGTLDDPTPTSNDDNDGDDNNGDHSTDDGGNRSSGPS